MRSGSGRRTARSISATRARAARPDIPWTRPISSNCVPTRWIGSRLAPASWKIIAMRDDRLARPAFADKTDRFPGPDRKVDARDGAGPVAPSRKADDQPRDGDDR